MPDLVAFVAFFALGSLVIGYALFTWKAIFKLKEIQDRQALRLDRICDDLGIDTKENGNNG